MLTGKILVTEYTQDEATGDYTVKLTDGTTVTIYSGEVDMSKMPLFSVNASGHWAYTLNGKTEEVLVNGKTVDMMQAEDGSKGVIPKLKVDPESGYWMVSVDNGKTYTRLGDNQIAAGDKLVTGGIFSGVTPDLENGEVIFKVRETDEEIHVSIDDFSLEITATDEERKFSLNQEKTFSVKQHRVEYAAIEKTSWKVELKEEQLILKAPASLTNPDKKDEDIYIRIFSKTGRCKLVKFTVMIQNS